MKKIIMVLALCLVLSVTAFAGAVSTVQTLGIMTGDQAGNMNLSKPVTRAEFSKMLVAASSDRDNNQPPSSVFKDLKADHWASGYVKLAVSRGWIYGYTNGTFGPENPIQSYEAYAMGLRLMGYDTANLVGNFKSAILNMAEQAGLNDGISNTGVFLRSDCAILFDNILTGMTPNGVTYGSTLGYTVVNGELDLNSVTEKDLEGPYVYLGNWSGNEPDAVYLNDKVSSLDALHQDDVYYYNPITKAVYGYRNKTYGTISAITGGSMTPSAVTVNGISYPLASNSAKQRIKDGDILEGQVVTLLLNQKDEVVDMLDQVSGMTSYYGVITKVTRIPTGLELEIMCTDGVVRTFETEKTGYKTGTTLEITIGETTSMTLAAAPKLSGKITTTQIGNTKLSPDLVIMDVRNGQFKTVYLSQLVGKILRQEDVLSCRVNEDNELVHLMLDDATGNLLTYGYLDNKWAITAITQLCGYYDVVIDGVKTTIATPGVIYPVPEGGIALHYKEDGSIDTMSALTEYTIDNVDGLQAKSGSKVLTLAEDVDVILKTDQGYAPATLEDARESTFEMKGYQDKCNLGGIIRLIILHVD